MYASSMFNVYFCPVGVRNDFSWLSGSTEGQYKWLSELGSKPVVRTMMRPRRGKTFGR